jgi:very-short-patch-repair endonuclease
MATNRKLTDTVWAFLDRVAPMYARMEVDRFSQDMHSDCIERGMESPIEDLFWVAVQVLCKAQFADVNPDPIPVSGGSVVWPAGIYIEPQAKIDKYRVDFLMHQSGNGPDEILTPVIVELDGHDFHDKDKRQRSYEKARDRHLLRAGYRVVHFTGSDVVKDPFAVAFEVLQMLGLYVGTGIEKYDPQDPLNQG